MTVRIKTVPKYEYWGEKSLDGNRYRLDFKYLDYTRKWYVEIKGLSNDVNIKVALLPGKDLLAPFGYSAQLGELWVVDNTQGNANPNFDDMGTRWTLEYTPLNA